MYEIQAFEHIINNHGDQPIVFHRRYKAYRTYTIEGNSVHDQCSDLDYQVLDSGILTGRLFHRGEYQISGVFAWMQKMYQERALEVELQSHYVGARLGGIPISLLPATAPVRISLSELIASKRIDSVATYETSRLIVKSNTQLRPNITGVDDVVCTHFDLILGNDAYEFLKMFEQPPTF